MDTASLDAETVDEDGNVLRVLLPARLVVTRVDSLELEEVAPKMLVQHPLNLFLSLSVACPLGTFQLKERMEVRKHLGIERRLHTTHLEEGVVVEANTGLVLFSGHAMQSINLDSTNRKFARGA